MPPLRRPDRLTFTPLREGLSDGAEVARTVAGLRTLEANDGALFPVPPVGQVWSAR